MFAMRTRIEAEEQGFELAESVFVSTEHEKRRQCGLYDSFREASCHVLAPGVNFDCPSCKRVWPGLLT